MDQVAHTTQKLIFSHVIVQRSMDPGHLSALFSEVVHESDHLYFCCAVFQDVYFNTCFPSTLPMFSSWKWGRRMQTASIFLLEDCPRSGISQFNPHPTDQNIVIQGYLSVRKDLKGGLYCVTLSQEKMQWFYC